MSCYNSILVPASAEVVWNAVSDFHDMSWAPDVVTSLEAVGETDGHEVGARRVLNGVFHETLLSRDASTRTLTYSIDDGPDVVAADAVANYMGTIRVAPVTLGAETGAFIEWLSVYESPDPDAVFAFCTPIYTALLTSLRAHFEQEGIRRRRGA